MSRGEPSQRAIRQAAPRRIRADDFPAGSMGPKVDAACKFVNATGRRAAIGALADIALIVEGKAGTTLDASQVNVAWASLIGVRSMWPKPVSNKD